MQTCDVVVLGAGAAGLMCAIEAGRRGRRVLVLDHADRIGKKILISGGGRCNFTNINARAENFLSANPHFAKSALARYTPADILALIEKHGIPWHEKTLGQLFCDRSAQDVITMLERECAAANVEIRPGTRILSVSRDTGFLIETLAGPIRTSAVVVATGGLSIPKMGATSFGYDLARQFGLRIVECRPALVPFVFNPEDCSRWCDLTGLSTEVIASAQTIAATITARGLHPSFREKMLFTHRGLSGPAILQISSYWKPGEPITLDLAPNSDASPEVFAPLLTTNARRDPATALQALRAALPARLAERWLTLNPPARWTNTALADSERDLHEWQITPAGTEGYAKAEVTAGGIDTNELDSSTMQSKRVPGLYFIGEVVDVTGWLGGYNFQWAWASGAAAGRAI
ncbi:BaiN/RdsA family NAD(P)/FAD-dependent oxidoreductase [Edaphobacter bradus]|uniref:NAD(P)/FAD-dependent oxidoreductase n=1 Tax=Edaphobacter bradus TaxID=2259016 RepID=UPI0021E043EB|nr:NAD(P)/FAD-dependent oxidoreductase [Edaphobacter bradus]